MAVSVTLQTVTQIDGKLFARYTDGSELEFSSLDELRAHLDEMASNAHTARCMLLGWWIARDRNASNRTLVEGKTLTYDLSVPNAIRVQ